MERKEFLKRLGLAGIVAPIFSSCKEDDETADATTNINGTCVVGDTETDGPYPLYSERGASIERKDITDGREGIPLDITITVRNASDDCKIFPNAQVDIWHCDKDGYYSGYTNSGYLGTQDNSSLIFCRGVQTSDSNGQVKFFTIYPGWYQGRVTHIHAQVYVNGVLKLTTQIAFPDAVNTAVYKTSLYSGHGQNTTVNTTDNIIKDSLDNELATVVVNADGGYHLTHTIYIAA
jgi:protocatechuate 3,4-dioxygenase beta subunit